MGNCCKKRLESLKDKISSNGTNRRESNTNSKKTNENESLNYKEKNNIMILKDNQPSDSKEMFLYKNKKKRNGDEKEERESKFDIKKFKEYKDILQKYLDFRMIIDDKCKIEKIYVIEKDENDELISLYNNIIEERNNEEDEDKIIKDFILNGNEIKKNFKVMDFEKCKKRIKDERLNKIDLLNSELCNKLNLKMENNDVTYINPEKNSEFRYLLFKNKKCIKINIINRIFSLKEIIDENNINNILNDSCDTYKKGNNINIIKNTKVKKKIIDNLINNNDENKDIISLEIKSEKNDENNSKNNNIHESLVKEEKENDRKTEIKGESNEFIMVNEENPENKENKDLIIMKEENKEKDKENYLIQISFQILLLYNIQNKKIKCEEVYYLANKNIIELIIQEINKNKEVNDINSLINLFLEKQENIDNIQIVMQQFKQDNINLFEREYDFNNINKETLFLEKKEFNRNKNKIGLIIDFVILSQEIYELLSEFFNLETNEDINKIFHKIELLNSDEKNIVVSEYEKNIYFCELKENKGIKIFNPIILLFYNTKELYLKEKEVLEKKNFDIYIYLQQKNLDVNNYTQTILDEENLEIGFFINLNQPMIKEEKNDEKEENNKQNKPIGLIGINSNSYLNSLLQCLYHIPELTNFFISDKNFLTLNEEFFLSEESFTLNDIEINKDSLSFKYLEIIYHLYHKKQNNKYIKYYSSKNILEYIQNKEPKQFEKNKGSNPKILCDYFIKTIKEELNEKENIRDLKSINSIDSILQNEETFYEKYLKDFKFKNKSIIDQFFAGIKLKNFICEECKESEQIFKDFYYLNFSLEKVGKNMENKFKKIDLNECFQYYFCNQKCEKACQKCGKKTNNSIISKIYLAPKILIIFLENTKEKGSNFKIDMEIDINEYTKERNEGYKLIGMITYFQKDGSEGGYQAYCYSNEYNKWYYLFDEYIDEVDDFNKYMEKTKCIPYIFFYRDISLY